MTELLLKNGFNPNLRNSNNNTPMHHAVVSAIKHKNSDIIKLLARSGVDLSATVTYGNASQGSSAVTPYALFKDLSEKKWDLSMKGLQSEILGLLSRQQDPNSSFSEPNNPSTLASSSQSCLMG